jgi:uncharacterized membrane protein (UPF0127 family)
MRFALDLVFVGRHGRPTGVRRNVPPRRSVFDRRARSVIEVRAGQADRLLAALGADVATQPPATRRRRRNVSADRASSSVTFSSSD